MKNKGKKVGPFIIVSLAVLTFTACGKKKNPTTRSTTKITTSHITTSKTTTKIKEVGFNVYLNGKIYSKDNNTIKTTYGDKINLNSLITVKALNSDNSEINLTSGYTFNTSYQDNSNAGNYNLTVKYKNYSEVSINIVVEKANYKDITYDEVIPNGIYNEFRTLDEYYPLSEGFSWKDGSIVPSLGTNEYIAIYNSDKTNYNDFLLPIEITTETSTINYGELIEGIEPTCYLDGILDHYEVLGKYYDKYFNEINSIVADALGHEYKDGYCIHEDCSSPELIYEAYTDLIEDDSYVAIIPKDFKAETLIIPKEYNGKPIVYLVSEDYYNGYMDNDFNYNIKNIVLPETTKMYVNFAGIVNLENVTYPKNETSNIYLTEYAFENDENYTKLVQTKSVILEENALSNSYITDLELLDSLVDLSYYYNDTLNFRLKTLRFNNEIEDIEMDISYDLENLYIPKSMVNFTKMYDISNPITINNVYYDGSLSDWINISTFNKDQSAILQFITNFYYYDGSQYVKLNNTLAVPEDIKEINSFAFYGYSGINAVILNDKIEQIKTDSFTNCPIVELFVNGCTADITDTGLDKASITYDNGTTSKLKEAGDFRVLVEDDNLILFSYNGNSKEVTIPSLFTVDGITYKEFVFCSQFGQTLNGVEKLIINSCDANMEKAFMNATSVKEVVLNENITSLASYMFSGCSNLSKINLDNIITYNDYCLENTNLLEFTLTNVSSSGKCILANSKVEKLIIDGNNTYANIDKDIFAFMNNLTLIVLNDDDFSASSASESYFQVSTNAEVKLYVSKNITSIKNYLFYSLFNLTTVEFEDGCICESIGQYAFYGTKIKNITLPETITAIDKQAFANNSYLEEINASGVINIGTSIFINCSHIKKINMPKLDLSSINGTDKLFLNGSGAPTTLEELTVYNLPIYLAKIIGVNGNATDTGNDNSCLSSLKTLTITGPSISGSVLYRAKYIQYLYLTNEDGVTITSMSLNGMSGLKEFYAKKIISIENNSLAGTNNYSKFVVESVKELYDGIFSTTNINLNYVSLGNDLEVIPSNFLLNRKDITLANTAFNNVKIVGENAFYNCKLITSIDLPNIESIGKYAFGKSSLESITLSDKLVSIGESAFAYTQIEEIVISDSCEVISALAFSECSLLKDVTIGSGVKSIGKNAFDYVNIDNLVYNAIECEDFSSPMFSVNNLTIGKNVKVIPAYFLASLSALEVDLSNTSIETIHSYSFSNLVTLESIILPNTLTSICNGAFSGCSYLTNVTFNEGLKTIDDNAFSGCDLTEVVLPSTITSIGSLAFRGSKIKELTLPINLENLDSTAFDASDINLTLNSKKLNDFGCEVDFSVSKLTIGSDVTAIPSYMFSGSKIQELDLSKLTKLTTIGSYAFSNSALLEVLIPSCVATIGSYAFANCENLSDIIIGNNVEVISPYAFANVKASLTINSNKITKVENAFDNAEFDTVKLGSNITAIPDYMFENVLIGKIDLSSATSLKTIGNYAFDSATITDSITLGNNELTIGAYAFVSANIAAITIPNTVKSIGSLAFINSTIDSLTYDCNISVENPFTAATIYSFTYGKNVNSLLTLPTSVKVISFDSETTIDSISDNAFKNYTLLSEITLPNTITSIGANAFNGCSSLYEINIPVNVTTIGEKAFANCDSLQIINYNAKSISGSLADIFYDSGYGATLNIGSSVEDIPSYLIYCASLHEANITKVIFSDDSNIKSIGKFAFACSNLTTVSNYSFKDVSESEFQGTKISSFDFTNIEVIGRSAFSKCSLLENVSFSNNLTQIDGYAFSDCAKIGPTITIPETLTSIGSGVFSGCNGIKTIYYNAINANNSSGYNIIEDRSNDSMLYDVIIGEKVEAIPDYAFAGVYGNTNKSIKSIVFNSDDTLETIGINAFAFTTNITNITIPSGVEILESAFRESIGLKKVILGENVKINNYVFYDCSSLERVVLNSGVSVLNTNSECFRNCTNLATIVNKTDKVLTTGVTTGLNTNDYLCYYAQYILDDDIDVAEFSDDVYNYTIIGDVAYINEYIKGDDPIKVEIPKSIEYDGKTINKFALKNDLFKNMATIESVEFNSSYNEIIEIASNAFYNCTNLEIDSLPSTIINIGEQAFYHIKSINTASFDSIIIGNKAFDGVKINTLTLKNMSLNEKVYSQSGQFQNTTITNLNLYGMTVGYYIFYKSKITNLNIMKNDTKTYFTSEYSIHSATINTIYFNDENMQVDSSALSKITSISKLIIGKDIETLRSVFSGTKCESVEFEENGVLKQINTNAFAFANSASFDDFVIPDTVELIGGYIFGSSSTNIHTITNLTLGSGIKYMATNVLGYFTVVNNLYYNCKDYTGYSSSTNTSSNSRPFENTSTSELKGRIYKVYISKDIISIPAYTFYDGLIDEFAFDSDSSLETIGSNSFANIDNLRIDIPNSVTTICSKAFSGNKNLRIDIPNSVTTIENNAFNKATITYFRFDANISGIFNFDGSTPTQAESYFIIGEHVTKAFTFANQVSYKYLVIEPGCSITEFPNYSLNIQSSYFLFGGTIDDFTSLTLGTSGIIISKNSKDKYYYYSDEKPYDVCNSWHMVDGNPVIYTWDYEISSPNAAPIGTLFTNLFTETYGSNDVAGKLVVKLNDDTVTTVLEGENEYTYTFTPTDIRYSVMSGSITIEGIIEE